MSTLPLYRLTIKGIRRTVECEPSHSDTSWKKASDIMLAIGLDFCKSECTFTADSLLTVITNFLNNTPNDSSEGVYIYNFMNSNRSELLQELLDKELVVRTE